VLPEYEIAGTYGARTSARLPGLRPRRLTHQPTKEVPIGEVYLSFSIPWTATSQDPPATSRRPRA